MTGTRRRDTRPTEFEVLGGAGAGRLLLTHLLAQTSEDDLVRNAGQTFAGPVEPAREGYRYQR